MITPQTFVIEELQKTTYNVKKRFLDMYYQAHSGHIGSSLSCSDILVFIRFSLMGKNDKLILSKGHAAAALYSVLFEANDLDASIKPDSFYKDGTLLGAHPSPNLCSISPFATGSLGHGLSLSAGMALGARLKSETQKIFCITSDGELNEGSTWEAALFAPNFNLTNVVWFIDRNRIQAFGKTEEVMKLEPLADKLASFGWQVLEADGHDFESLSKCANKILKSAQESKPIVVICNTVKGHGVDFMENTVDWHYLPMNEEQYKSATRQLASAYKDYVDARRVHK